MHSLCLNFYIAHYLVSRGIIPQHWAFVAYVGAGLWVAWIGFSRVYMGMHTPIDIGGGALIAIMVLSSYLAVDGAPFAPASAPGLCSWSSSASIINMRCTKLGLKL